MPSATTSEVARPCTRSVQATGTRSLTAVSACAMAGERELVAPATNMTARPAAMRATSEGNAVTAVSRPKKILSAAFGSACRFSVTAPVVLSTRMRR